MWPGSFFPSSDPTGTMTTKCYCLVAAASSLMGQQIPSALHVLWHWSSVRTGEHDYPRLGGCPVHVGVHTDGATPEGRLDTQATLRSWLLEAGEMGGTPLYQNKQTQEMSARKT